MNELTQQGIRALKAGDKRQAKQLFQTALDRDRRDVQAWLWLSAVVETSQEQIECLQQVLRIDPDNQAAAKGIAQLISRGAASLQARQEKPASPVEPAPLAAVTPPPGVEKEQSGPGRAGRANHIEDREIFSVQPSLAPTLIRGGIGFIMAALFVFLFLSTPLGILFHSEENSTALFVMCLGTLLALLLLYPVVHSVIVLLFTSYTLTDRHLVIDAGVFAKRHKTIPVQKIQDVAYHQTFLERLLGIGDVIVESAGEWGSIQLKDLANCKERTQQILAIIVREDW